MNVNSSTNPMGVHIVRKCLGKKQAECVQGDDHLCTRWECAFESQNKDDFHKHSKNISKRVKWRELVEQVKPDKEGFYRCVYYSTDRHHVENHFQKGSTDPLSPSPSQIMRYKNYYLQQSRGFGKVKNSKRWVNFGGKREMEDDEEEGNISPEVAAREYKKLRQDASLINFFQENHASGENGEGKDGEHLPGFLPDQMKTDELIDMIEKKLELPRDMCQNALDRLHKHGFVIVSVLKGLKKEGWEKLDLPLAIEEELKNQINMSRAYNPWLYGMPFWGFPQNNVQWGNYYGMGSGAPPLYIPGVTSEAQEAQETHESVIGEGEIEAKGKLKDEKDSGVDGTEPHHHHHLGSTDNPSAPLVALSLVVPDEKKENERMDSQEEHQKKLMGIESGWGPNAFSTSVDSQGNK